MSVNIVRTIFFYSVFFIAIIIALIPCFFLSLLPASKRYDNAAYYFFMDLFYRLTLWSTGLSITITGKENITQGPTIYIANHQSALDILIIGTLLQRRSHLWFFKSELLKIPLYGFMANRMNIVVDRSTARKAMYSILEGIRLTQHHNRSLIIFPEGGRYADGKIHEFLWGFALIARKTNHPVVPILLQNVYKVLPSGSLLLNIYPITVHIGKPFFIQEHETDEQFVQRVRRWFIEQSKE